MKNKRRLIKLRKQNKLLRIELNKSSEKYGWLMEENGHLHDVMSDLIKAKNKQLERKEKEMRYLHERIEYAQGQLRATRLNW